MDTNKLIENVITMYVKALSKEALEEIVLDYMLDYYKDLANKPETKELAYTILSLLTKYEEDKNK